MNFREIATMVPLIILIFWMGLFPGVFLKYSEKSVEKLVNSKGEYRLSIEAPVQKAQWPKVGVNNEL